MRPQREPREPAFASHEELQRAYLAQRDATKTDDTGRQQRGYFLEKALYALLFWAGLSPRTSFRPVGEEIDGSFYLSHRVFLLEAKWKKDPLPASVLYAFKGKVDGKLAGTIGVFVSMSGYAPDALEATQKNKDANVIYFDSTDIEAVVLYNHTFLDVLDFKLRQAGELGDLYVPFEVPRKVAEADRDAEVVAGPHQVFPLLDSADHQINVHEIERRYRIHVFCEGPSDVAILSSLVRRIVEEQGLFENVDFRFVALQGKSNLFNLSAAVNNLEEVDGVLVVVDSDGADTVVQSKLKARILRSLRGLLRAAIRVVAEVLFIDPYLDASLSNAARFIRSIREFVSGITSSVPWEEDARTAVRTALAGAEWDYSNQSVAVRYLEEYGRAVVCQSVDELHYALVEIASMGALNSMPFDAGEAVFEPDYDEIVSSELEWFLEELIKMGWR